MAELNRAPNPYDFLPSVAAFHVESNDVTDGQMLQDDQVMNIMGLTGGNCSPHLKWSGFPRDTRSFAVTCFDPDAPTASGFWHWVVFNIPVSCDELPTGAGSFDKQGLPLQAIHVRNDVGTHEFLGAGPPEGDPPHRYFFVVHAVDAEDLGVTSEATPAVVGFTLRFHTLARAFIAPIYAR